MSFIRNYYEPNCTSPNDDCDPKILPTSDKRGHKRAKRAHHGKRESQTVNLNRKEPLRPTKKDQNIMVQKEANLNSPYTWIFFVFDPNNNLGNSIIYMSVHVKTVDKNTRTFSLSLK